MMSAVERLKACPLEGALQDSYGRSRLPNGSSSPRPAPVFPNRAPPRLLQLWSQLPPAPVVPELEKLVPF
jgi:hypothetical protein